MALTPTQFKIWDSIRRSPGGVTAQMLAEKIYFDRYNGAPQHARTVIYATIRSLNFRLAAAGLQIALADGRRSAYTIQHADAPSIPEIATEGAS